MTDFWPQRERKRGHENEKDNIVTNASYVEGIIMDLVDELANVRDLSNPAT